MKLALLPLVLCLASGTAAAAEITSAYTPFAIDTTCRTIEAGDGYVYAGTWSCPGAPGPDLVIASADDREFVGFGANGSRSCSFLKTFHRFNAALSPVEWRMKGGTPFAAIERWRVVMDDEGNTVTWLVVTALKVEESCPVHYVAGSYPEANAAARRAADNLAERFDCESDIPTFDSTVGPPLIELSACRELARE